LAFGLDTLFLLAWVLAGFVVVRLVAIRSLRDARVANTVAAAVAAAFFAGALWPFSHRIDDAGGALHANAPASGDASPAAASGAAPPNLAGARNVSIGCARAGSPEAGGASGNLDVVFTGTQRLPPDGVMRQSAWYDVQGWAADAKAGAPARGVCLLVDGVVDRTAQAYYGLQRPDVVTVYHNARLLLSGFDIRVPAGSLATGRHRLQLGVRLYGRRLVAVGAPQDVTVR